MKRLTILLLVSAAASLPAQHSGANSGVASLLDIRRIYVGQLVGGAEAEALRALIISSLDSTKLFILTDKEDRADAILKGAANDKAFTDTFDDFEGVNGHEQLGKSSSGSGVNRIASLYGANSVGENESHHSKERKHEAYATVRLCNRDGDVLWSTTQESLGAKFRGASADVAAKIARQITLDYERARRTEEPAPALTKH